MNMESLYIKFGSIHPPLNIVTIPTAPQNVPWQ